jgi:transposase
VPAHRLSEWRDRVLIAAESALKERERDARDEEIERLKSKVGEITMANELLYSKIDRLEAGRPLVGRRLRK